MEWVLSPRRCRARLIVGAFRGGRGGQHDVNTVFCYQRLFFSKITFLAFYILVTKCSALLIPVPSAEIGSNQLCPNPVDWQEPFTSLFPYRFFPNNVVVMDLVRSSGLNTSARTPCRFRIGGSDTGVKAGRALLVTLQQRPRPVSFMQRCSRVLEFPGRWGEDHGPSMTCVTAEEPDRPEELSINIRTMGQVTWTSGGRLVFELPYQGYEFTAARFLIALFRVTTQNGACELQIQQYYWSRENDSWSCAKDLKRKLLNNVCGRIPCSKQDAILNELKGYLVPTSDLLLVEAIDDLEIPPSANIRTIGYFLKGLLLPLIISLSATMAYIIWRKRMKAYSAATGLDGAVSLGTQTNQSTGREEEGVLIQFEEEEERDAKDKPPTYESLLEPPSYDQAMSPSPIPLSPSHLMELDHDDLERHLLLKTPPPEDFDVDKTIALTPSRSPCQGPSSCLAEDELDPLPPPPPFQ